MDIEDFDEKKPFTMEAFKTFYYKLKTKNVYCLCYAVKLSILVRSMAVQFDILSLVPKSIKIVMITYDDRII